MPRFKHTPLQNPLTQIRLLQLLPYNEDRDIRCSLQTHDLASAPAYVALSYECGPREPTVDILVEDCWFSVRHNLWLFLSQLKEKQRHHLVWADAVCISQLDIVERSAQVGVMGSIFQTAASTYAWLGWPSSFDAALLFDFFVRVARPRQSTQYEYEEWQHNMDIYVNTYMVPLKQALVLCQHSYFRRRWVIQELLHSKNVVLMWGEAELPWSILLLFLYEIAIPAAWWSWYKAVFRRPGVLIEIDTTLAMEIASWVGKFGRSTSRTIQRVSLLKLLCDFKDAECERQSDRIYSILSLSEEYDKLNVDYSLSAESLLYQIITCTRWYDLHDIRLVVDALEVQTPPLAHFYSERVRAPLLTTLTLDRVSTVIHVVRLPATIYATRQNLARKQNINPVAETEYAAKYMIKRSDTDDVCDALDDLGFCMTALAERCRVTSAYSPESYGKMTSTTSVTAGLVPVSVREVSTPASLDAQLIVCDDGSLAVCRCPVTVGDILCTNEAGILHVIRPTASKSQLVGNACLVLAHVDGAIAGQMMGRSSGLGRLPEDLHAFWTLARRYMTAHMELPNKWFAGRVKQPFELDETAEWVYQRFPPNDRLFENHLIIREAFRWAEQQAIFKKMSKSGDCGAIEAVVDVWDAIGLLKEEHGSAFSKSQTYGTQKHRHRRQAEDIDASEDTVLGFLLGESRVSLSQNPLDSLQIDGALDVEA